MSLAWDQTLENSFKEQVCLERGEGFRRYMLHNATIPMQNWSGIRILNKKAN